MSPEARVGLVAVLALLVVFGFVLFLPGAGVLRPQGYSIIVRVHNAAGIDAGTPVRMSGVTVGRVASVQLSPANEALVTLTINADVQISQGARFQVATTGLVGERYLAVTPGPAGPPIPPGAVVQGEDPFSLERTARELEQVADQVSRLVQHTSALVQNANTLIGDPQMQADLRAALRNAREATAIARDVMGQVRATTSSVRRTASSVEGAAARVQRLVDTDVVAIAGDLRVMSENLVRTSERVNTFVDTTTAGGALSRDIQETASSLREAGQRIRQMAEDLQGLINPENVGKAREVVNDARATVKDARGVVQQAGALLQRVSGVIPQGLQGLDRQSLFTFNYEVWYDGKRSGHGFDLTLLPSAGRFYRIGLHDIGATNGAVLQLGSRLNPNLWWRAGVYESQFGLGLDYRSGGPLTVALDAYNLNLLTVDARLRYQVSPRWGLTLGGRSLFRDPALIFGLGTNF